MNPAPVKSEITIADVEKIDVRVGEILRVPVLARPETRVPNGTRAG